MKAETLIASEAGYRYQPTSKLALDVAVFSNSYSDLRTLEPGVPYLEQVGFQRWLVTDFSVANNMSGTSSGLETTTQYSVTPKWRLSGSVSWLRLALDLNPQSRDSVSEVNEQRAPHQKYEVRSYIDLSKAVELDTLVYFVSQIKGYQLPSYTRADVRLGWHLRSGLELSLQAENLLNSLHIELEPENFGRGRVLGRTLTSNLTWRF
jgi:iron complex outermembrane receptor protein